MRRPVPRTLLSPHRSGPAARAFAFMLLLAAADPSSAAPSELHLFLGQEPGARMGMAVDGAGDVDGDGLADLLVGITDASGASDEPGRATVFSGADGSELHLFVGGHDGDAFGSAVAGIGDVDGDGFDDVAVGARYSSPVHVFQGTVRVFSGLDGSLIHEMRGDEEGERLGYSLDAAGDVDGDGVPDLVAGAIFDNENGFWSGSAQVFSGATGVRLHRFDGDLAFDQLGGAVAGIGDLDGDGLADVAAGARDSDLGAPNGGLVRVYSGADGTVLLELLGTDEGEELGEALAGPGDVDDDGVPDVLVGAPSHDSNGSAAGSARVYSGRDGSVIFDFVGDSPGDALGYSVAGPGDVDGDGFPDLWIGAVSDDAGGAVTGSARLRSGRDGTLVHLFRGVADGDSFGGAVGAAGDVDGDGFPDLIVGASGDDRAGDDAGAAVVFSGGLTLQAPDPGVAGGENDFRVTRATPGGAVAVVASPSAGITTVDVPGCGPLDLALAPPLRLLGEATADGDGHAAVTRFLPPELAGETLHFQAVDRSGCEASNAVAATL